MKTKKEKLLQRTVTLNYDKGPNDYEEEKKH